MRRELRGLVRQRDGDLCAWCGRLMRFDIHALRSLRTTKPYPEAVTLDRVVPGADGGLYVVGNLVLACRECNTARGDTDAASFMDAVTWRGERA